MNRVVVWVGASGQWFGVRIQTRVLLTKKSQQFDTSALVRVKVEKIITTTQELDSAVAAQRKSKRLTKHVDIIPTEDLPQFLFPHGQHHILVVIAILFFHPTLFGFCLHLKSCNQWTIEYLAQIGHRLWRPARRTRTRSEVLTEATAGR